MKGLMKWLAKWTMIIFFAAIALGLVEVLISGGDLYPKGDLIHAIIE